MRCTVFCLFFTIGCGSSASGTLADAGNHNDADSQLSADAALAIDPCDAIGTTPGVCPGRGLVHQALDVELRAPDGSSLIFTLDGTAPSVASSTSYSVPVAIDPPEVGAVRVLRVATVTSGEITGTALHSYVFSSALLGQPIAPSGYPIVWGTTDTRDGDYEMDPDVLATVTEQESRTALEAIAIVSIQTDHESIWGDSAGIYMNPEEGGLDWEREVSFELMHSSGSIQSGAGLRIQGGSSIYNWKSAKLSMRLLFKTVYGAGKLKHRVFEDSAIKSFNGLVLDAHLNMTYLHPSHGQRVRALYTRDTFMSDLQRSMGGTAPHDRFVHLLINGLYWGVYDLHERPDADFAANYLGGSREDYDVVKHVGNNAVDGDTASWDAMMAIARAGLSEDAAVVSLGEYLNIEDFVNYMLTNLYGGNDDWPHHNWYAARRRTGGDGFHFFSWDAEHSVKDVNVNRFDVDSANTPGELWQALLQNAGFVAKVRARMDELLAPGGALYVNSVAPAVDAQQPENNRPGNLFSNRALEFYQVMILESARWGDNRRTEPYGESEWQAEYDSLMQGYFPQRSAIFDAQLP